MRDSCEQLTQWRIGTLSCVEQGRHTEAVKVKDFKGPASHAHANAWHTVTHTVRCHALPTCRVLYELCWHTPVMLLRLSADFMIKFVKGRPKGHTSAQRTA